MARTQWWAVEGRIPMTVIAVDFKAESKMKFLHR